MWCLPNGKKIDPVYEGAIIDAVYFGVVRAQKAVDRKTKEPTAVAFLDLKAHTIIGDLMHGADVKKYEDGYVVAPDRTSPLSSARYAAPTSPRRRNGRTLIKKRKQQQKNNANAALVEVSFNKEETDDTCLKSIHYLVVSTKPIKNGKEIIISSNDEGNNSLDWLVQRPPPRETASHSNKVHDSDEGELLGFADTLLKLQCVV